MATERLVPMKRLMLAAVFAALILAPHAAAWSWPVDGAVLKPFVFDPAHPYAAGQHRGVDVAGVAGSDIRAPAGGAVSFAGSVPSSGKTVTIQTQDGYSVTLVHLGSIIVARGAVIAEGAPVGGIGPSGDPEWPEPYVHLGVRVTAEAQGYVDPLEFLPPRLTPDVAPAPAPDASTGSEAVAEVPPTLVETIVPAADPAGDGATSDAVPPVVEPADAPVPSTDAGTPTAEEEASMPADVPDSQPGTGESTAATDESGVSGTPAEPASAPAMAVVTQEPPGDTAPAPAPSSEGTAPIDVPDPGQVRSVTAPAVEAGDDDAGASATADVAAEPAESAATVGTATMPVGASPETSAADPVQAPNASDSQQTVVQPQSDARVDSPAEERQPETNAPAPDAVSAPSPSPAASVDEPAATASGGGPVAVTSTSGVAQREQPRSAATSGAAVLTPTTAVDPIGSEDSAASELPSPSDDLASDGVEVAPPSVAGRMTPAAAAPIAARPSERVQARPHELRKTAVAASSSVTNPRTTHEATRKPTRAAAPATAKLERRGARTYHGSRTNHRVRSDAASRAIISARKTGDRSRVGFRRATEIVLTIGLVLLALLGSGVGFSRRRRKAKPPLVPARGSRELEPDIAEAELEAVDYASQQPLRWSHLRITTPRANPRRGCVAVRGLTTAHRACRAGSGPTESRSRLRATRPALCCSTEHARRRRRAPCGHGASRGPAA